MFIAFRFVVYDTDIFSFLHRPLHVPFAEDFLHAIRTQVYVHCTTISDFCVLICYFCWIFYWSRSIWAREQKNNALFCQQKECSVQCMIHKIATNLPHQWEFLPLENAEWTLHLHGETSTILEKRNAIVMISTTHRLAKNKWALNIKNKVSNTNQLSPPRLELPAYKYHDRVH
jgi:hypothetical protein